MRCRRRRALCLFGVLAAGTLWLCGAGTAAAYGPVAWGDENYGQLGNGEFEGFRIAPVAVGRLDEEVAVNGEVAVGEESVALAAGFEHALALLRNGKVVAWGENGQGQLGDGTSLGPETCVYFSVCSTVPVEVTGLHEAAAVAAGYYFSLALLDSGRVVAWGDGGQGQLGDGSEFDSDVPVQVTGLSGVTAIAGGFSHSLALLKNGTVMAWGGNEYGQLGDGSESKSDVPVEVQGLHEVTAIAAGADHSLALLSNGIVMAWGENASGQLGDGSETDSDVPVEVRGLHEVTAIAGDGSHSLALLKDGKVMAWGNNNAGQLGDGSETNSDVPVEVQGLSGVTAIAAGVQHSLALLGSGEVMGWGDNGWGELGNGNRENTDLPVQASGPSEVTAIAAGGYSSYAERGEIGEIAGEVTSAATGDPIEAARVCAIDVRGPGHWRCATTDAAGEYAVTVHESASYDVRFSAPPGSGYVATQYYDGQPSPSEETAVTATLGATTAGIDARLAEGGRIAGTVTGAPANAPVAGVEVCAPQSGAECVLTSANGEYTLSGLAPGRYEVEFQPSSGMYLPQYWDGKRSAAEGQPVTVAAGQTTPGVDAELQPPTRGAITGDVRDGNTTQGIKGIEVCAYAIGGEEGNGEEGGLFGECAETNGSGEYAILELPAGRYLVEFSSPFQSGLDYVAQYFNGAASAADATPVEVTTKSVVSGIDAQMSEGGRIAGRVTDAATAAIAGIEVCAFSTSTEGLGCALTDAQGEYVISALAGGAYDVEFAAPPGSGLNYVIQYYDGERSGAAANPVSVTEGATTAGIDAQLEEGGRIEGTVTDASTGAGVKGVLVCALTTNGESSRCGVTDTGGGYAIAGLVGGRYKVGFDGGKNYVTQYYEDRLSLSEGQAVAVTVGDTAAGIDAALDPTDAIAPTNTKSPLVLGAPVVGETLLCADGLWAGSPTPSLTERWLRDGTPILGAASEGYTVQSADAGHALACEVTARSSAGERSAVSPALAIPGGPAGPGASTTGAASTRGVGRARSKGPRAPLVVGASTLTVSGGVARVRVRCQERRCAGTVELTMRAPNRRRGAGGTVSHGAQLVLAKGSLSLTGKGRSTDIMLRLTAIGRRRLARAGRHNPVAAQLSLSAPGAKTIVIRSVLVTSDRAHVAIVDGSQIAIGQAPWQVVVEAVTPEKKGLAAILCGGSIVDASHILTAAHCVFDATSGGVTPAEDFTVRAGTADLASRAGSEEQARAVTDVRPHPYYVYDSDSEGVAPDDVALLTLQEPLVLGPAAAAISPVSPGASPTEGASVGLTGFGEENPLTNELDGKLYSLGMTIGWPRECGGENDAVLLCASSPSGSPCNGDSGSALTLGSPVAQVGVEDAGYLVAGKRCVAGSESAFANLAAPEIQDFLDGIEEPPRAPRGGHAVIREAPINDGVLSCEPGTWSGQPTFTITFLDGGDGQILQQGSSTSYAVPAAEVGHKIACEVQAANVGGTGVGRTPGLQATVAAPPSPPSPPPAGAATPPPPAVASRVSLAATQIAVRRGGTAHVELKCAGSSACAGKLTLTARLAVAAKGRRKEVRRGTATRTVTIATARFSIATGATTTVDVRLDAAARAALGAAHGRLSARLALLDSAPSAASAHTTAVQLV